MPDQHSAQNIREAFKEIIEGKFVKRIKHDLSYGGTEYSRMFIEELKKCGYLPMTVADVRVEPGERIPAFIIRNNVAFFGWVFWEQFTTWKLRKLWGSLIKNKLGDWEIQIPVTRSETIYANENLKLEMDIDHPPEF